MQYLKISSDRVFGCFTPAARLAGSERMDRRHQKRFELQAKVHFSWLDAGGVRSEGQGITRDISEMGVFVQTSECPPSGAAVRLQMRATALSTSGLMMQTSGRVVRVEPSAQAAPATGFAAATRSLKLRDCKPVVTDLGAKYRLGSQPNTESWSNHSRKPN